MDNDIEKTFDDIMGIDSGIHLWLHYQDHMLETFETELLPGQMSIDDKADFLKRVPDISNLLCLERVNKINTIYDLMHKHLAMLQDSIQDITEFVDASMAASSVTLDSSIERLHSDKTIGEQITKAYEQLGQALTDSRRIDIPIKRLNYLLQVAQETGAE